MQDADRLREQVGEMATRAEARAAVAQDHRELVQERRAVAEREILKLRHMLDVFAMSERVLRQRKSEMQEQEEPPSELELGGLDDAITNVVNLGQQAQRAITHNEGASAALGALDQTFEQRAQEATARARGMAVQGSRAVGVAERREMSRAAQEASQGSQEPLVASSGGVSSVSGFLDPLADTSKS